MSKQQMPQIVIAADNNNIVTVNPDWCDWYEATFETAKGTGYEKGREIMFQIEQAYAKVIKHPIRPFSSIEGAMAVLANAGILRQNVSKAGANIYVEGYFNELELSALLYLVERNAPLVFPEKDENGLPKDGSRRKTFMEQLGFTEATCPPAVLTALRNVRVAIEMHYENKPNPSIEYISPSKHLDPEIFTKPIQASYTEGLTGLMDALLEQPNASAAKSILPTGSERLNQLLMHEGGGLRRGEWPGEVASRTAINRSAIAGGIVTHSFEKGDDDYPMLIALLNRLYGFETIFEGLELGDMRLDVDAPWAADGQLCFKQGDGFYTLLVDKPTGAFNLASIKLADNGIIVVFEHNSATVGYNSLSQIFEVFTDISPEKVKAAVAAIHKEQASSNRAAMFPEAAQRAADIMAGNMVPLHGRPLLDITGEPVPKYMFTDLPGDRYVEKDLSVLINMNQEEFNELGYRITATLGMGTFPEEDERLKGITHRDYLKVAIMRLKGEI